MHRSWIGWVLLSVFGLSACLEPAAISPLNPKPVDKKAESSVTFSLPRIALAELSELAQFLEIRAYKGMPGEAIGEEVHEAFKFAVTDQGLYALEGLPLGETVLVIDLQDENSQVIADGSVRAMINLGEQTLPPVVLKPKKPSSVALDLQVNINLINFPDSAPQFPAEPEAVRAILKSYRCQACHSGPKAKAGLDLMSYPYKNTSNESLPLIISTVLDTMTGAGGLVMPPSSAPSVKAEDVTLVKNFLQTVNDATSAGSNTWIKDVKISLSMGGPGRLESTMLFKDGNYILADKLSLLAGTRYSYSILVMGPGGSKLFEVLDAVLDVPLDGKVPLKFDINYKAPTVKLPVVVETGVN